MRYSGSFRFGALLAFFVFVDAEVFQLLLLEALGLVGEVVAGLDGLFAGEVEAGFAGEGAENLLPVGSGFIERLDRDGCRRGGRRRCRGWSPAHRAGRQSP